MPAIVPATNQAINVGNVANTLGNSVKNMNGFRGFGGSVPASGPISMSECQKIQYGVGYYNTWRVPSAGVDQGEWSSTSITNRGSMTYIVWLASNAASYWRNLYHITGVSPADNVRRPATWIYNASTGFHCKIDTTLANDGIDQTTARIVNNGSVYMLAITVNSTTQTAYLNTGAGQAFTLAGAPNNSLSTDRVYSPDTFYAATGDYALNRLWFFPYPMTSTQITNYYNSLSGTIGTPAFPPTGGTITVANGYRIHRFTTTGTSTFTVTAATVSAQTLVVAGGGGGGYSIGGGGGAGGLLFASSTSFAIGSYTITVGAGGAGSSVYAQRGTNGGNSSISGVSITAIGGGGGTGQTAEYNSLLPGGTGGSGGGGSRWDSRAPPGYGLGTTGQGNRGGTGFATGASGSSIAGGGGGGAGAVGGNGTATATNNASGIGGAGGAGSAITIGGSTATYAGGGGSNGNTGGAGGSGGGGFGTTGGYGTSVGSGTANTGGGGGGGSASVAGGTGGSGIVVIAYLWP